MEIDVADSRNGWPLVLVVFLKGLKMPCSLLAGIAGTKDAKLRAPGRYPRGRRGRWESGNGQWTSCLQLLSGPSSHSLFEAEDARCWTRLCMPLSPLADECARTGHVFESGSFIR